MKEYYFKDTIYYKKNIFRPSRKILVFVHGLSGSSSAWLKYEKKFEKKYNILSFDLRGHGKSLKFRDYKAYEMKNLAEDMHDLLQFLKIKHPIIVCHSFGVFVVLEYLELYQKEVSAVVFLSPSFKVGERLRERILKFILKTSPLFKLFPFREIKGRHVNYSKYKNTGDWNLRRTVADVGNTSLRIYAYCTKQSYSFNKEKLLEKIKIPVLLMHGKKDSIFPVENSLKMHEKIKGSKLELIENTDHIVVLNNFREVSKGIEKFVKSP